MLRGFAGTLLVALLIFAGLVLVAGLAVMALIWAFPGAEDREFMMLRPSDYLEAKAIIESPAVNAFGAADVIRDAKCDPGSGGIDEATYRFPAVSDPGALETAIREEAIERGWSATASSGTAVPDGLTALSKPIFDRAGFLTLRTGADQTVVARFSYYGSWC